LTNVGGTLFFTARDLTDGVTRGRELWKTDGTPEGTVLVKDIEPGPSDGFPDRLTNVGGTLFFAAFDSIHGTELWKSDGTEEGTVLVKDINLGRPGSSPGNLTDVGGTLFFTAVTPETGNELWKSDGTAEGTVLVKDINPGTGFGLDVRANLTVVGGTLFFAATDPATGRELWKSDGTAAGTVLVKDSNIGPASSIGIVSGANLANVGGTLFFAAARPESGTELWKSDGTAEGTVLVKDVNPGSASSTPLLLTNVGGTLFFRA